MIARIARGVVGCGLLVALAPARLPADPRTRNAWGPASEEPGSGAEPRSSQVQTADPQVLIAEAKQYFEALDYEHAVRALDQAIAVVDQRPPQDPVRKQLALAYEMRARSRFGLGDQKGASADFTALLRVDPSYALTGQISPQVVALYNEAVKATVTTLTLTVTPPTAEVRLDGEIVSTNGAIPVSVGEHVVTAKRAGYREVSQPVQAIAEQPAQLTVALERVSAILAILTVPADVEVVIDGISHGRTAAGPPPAEYAEAAAKAGIPASELSSVMIVPDVPPGSHQVEFRRDCHVPVRRPVTIEKPDDYTLGPIKLAPAVATLTAKIAGNSGGGAPPRSGDEASVFLDGQMRGVTPLTLADVCEGDHVLELRSPSGRYVRRVTARTGDRIPVEGALKPAFALVSTSGSPAGFNTDLRLVVERALEPAHSIALFAPPDDQVNRALKAQQLPDGWLAFDGSKRPLGVSAEMTAAQRRDLSNRLAKTLDSQGIASVTVPSKLNRTRIVVALLAAGSSEPDILELMLDNPESIAAAVERLDRPLSFFRPSIGVLGVDVADAPGPVIVKVDPTGPAAKAGIQPGDVLLKANAQPVADATSLVSLLAGRKAGDELTLELKDRAGAAKRADVKVFMTPTVIGMTDRTLLVNRILLDLRARLLAQQDALEEAVMRLNLAAALARVENWSEARAELQRVKLPEGPGVGSGTVQYLLGLCADGLGNRSEAEAAWRAAAGSESLLTEDGPSVKELAEARLADLQRRSSS